MSVLLHLNALQGLGILYTGLYTEEGQGPYTLGSAMMRRVRYSIVGCLQGGEEPLCAAIFTEGWGSIR